MENTPKETLYINNLNDKVKVHELKTNLFFLFTTFGEIVEIVCRLGMRGQAFIIFKSITSATQSLRQLQGFEFCGKKLQISYASEKSDVISKLDGTFVRKDQDKSKYFLKKGAKPDMLAQKKVKIDNPQTTANTKVQKEVNQENSTPPSNVLFLEDLPQLITQESLIVLFKQYPGYCDIRFIGAKNVAFIEYNHVEDAQMALAGLNGFKLTQDKFLKITYAKA